MPCHHLCCLVQQCPVAPLFCNWLEPAVSGTEEACGFLWKLFLQLLHCQSLDVVTQYNILCHVFFYRVNSRQLGDKQVRLNFQGKNIHVSTSASYIVVWCGLTLAVLKAVILLSCSMFLHIVHTWISLGQTEAQSWSTHVSLLSSKFLFAVLWKKIIPGWHYTILCVILLFVVCKCSVVTIVCRHCLPHVLNK